MTLISNYCTLQVSVEYDEASRIDIFKLAVLLLKHLQCVSRLITLEDEAEYHEKKIANGEQFTCPIHKCFICKQTENKEDENLQFAICRRCPRAYHRKCLPK